MPLNRRFEINMDRSRAPRAFRDEQNLWRNDLTRIYRLIGRQVDTLSRRKDSVFEGNSAEPGADERSHLSIAIFGPSGSGKSSLIRTLADDVARPHRKVLKEKWDKKVATLPVMDPTTWASTDQFLYAFLAAALEEERNQQERKEHGYLQGLSPVQLAFQEVNEYLRVVDEPEHSEEHDPLGLSLQKLERHTSGLRLKKALGNLIEELAKELGAEVVLLPVDDLDMAPYHLVDALQSYQSFLAHPRLIPIFTFTDRMPEELIEVFYKRQLGEASGHQRLGGTNRLTINEQMAVQFLARCFPVRNRIRLGPAPARVQRAIYFSETIRDEKEEQPERQVLELLIQSSFLLFGYPDHEEAHQIRAALRPSTLRRQFQVVDAMADCRLWALRTPQFATMAGLDRHSISAIAGSELHESKSLPTLCTYASSRSTECKPTSRTPPRSKEDIKDRWETWRNDPTQRRRLAKEWPSGSFKLRHGSIFGPDEREDEPLTYEHGYYILAKRLKNLEIGATWATIFNGATWSLLNVHRDTLRELGLFLEDLYSWSPKELRSVVLENILAQDQVTRRTVVDRWFNRTDYRRSQVLSLLAANVFRPWMDGEEPYGDEETPIREQIELEKERPVGRLPYLDEDWDTSWNEGVPENGPERRRLLSQIRKRLTFSAPKGLLWFLDLTLGFYLPQIMARNWDKALSLDIPIKSRMSGNGWDLHHAATNAVRIADAKQEIFSFGIMFLHPGAYRRVLETPRKEPTKKWDNATAEPLEEAIRHRGTDATDPECMYRRHLLVRIWTSCGYSSGRYWSAFSLWRGLSFAGQVLELGLRHPKALDKKYQVGTSDKHQIALEKDLFRLVRTHGLQGLVPGSLLNRNSSDDQLLQAFPKWEPRSKSMENAIRALTLDLMEWLELCWTDLIYPLPAGDIWLGWKDCFIHRIHGEYILGGLWPRLNSAYLEEYSRRKDWSTLARLRGLGKEEEPWESSSRDPEDEKIDERFRWSAAVAAGAWCDLLLEYWRGCPPMLKLLLTCPTLFRSNERFGCTLLPEDPDDEGFDTANQQKIVDLCFEDISVLSSEDLSTFSEEKIGDSYLGELERRTEIDAEVAKLEPQERRAYETRLGWLTRLSLPAQTWKDVRAFWAKSQAGRNLVPSELAIPRAQTEQFTTPEASHHAVRFEPAEIRIDEAKVPASGKNKGKTISKTNHKVYLNSDPDKPEKG